MGIFLLGLSSGFFSTYLGIGSGLFFLAFLPFLTPLSSIEIIQISLFLVLTINFVNVILFAYQKLIPFSLLPSCLLTALPTAALCGFMLGDISNTHLRFILLGFIFLSWVLIFIPTAWFQAAGKNLNYLAGLLAGSCSGLTGLGGGLILSPFLHESSMLEVRKRVGLITSISLCNSLFSLLGIEMRSSLLLVFSENTSVLQILIAGGFVGLVLGHFFNIREKASLRKWAVRAIIALVFICILVDLAYRL